MLINSPLEHLKNWISTWSVGSEALRHCVLQKRDRSPGEPHPPAVPPPKEFRVEQWGMNKISQQPARGRLGACLCEGPTVCAGLPFSRAELWRGPRHASSGAQATVKPQVFSAAMKGPRVRLLLIRDFLLIWFIQKANLSSRAIKWVWGEIPYNI